MDLYHVTFDIKNDAKALQFSQALEAWMGFLQTGGVIQSWRFFRRKLNLTSSNYRDFILMIEVKDLAQLDQAFRLTAKRDHDVEELYRAVHEQILNADFGLYRPFPDPEQAERVALL
ncbi:MAG: hypothetical protein N4A61_10320 [Pelagimonas sp.]|jgi:hypothetical protein|nr:hypothetical protein [Pelagimonas sp.]